MNNISFYIGPRGCGKSLFAEKELSTIDRKLYIGTLPNTLQYRTTIEAHQTRRGPNWTTIETSSSLDHDIEKMISSIKNDDSLQACLLDGLLTWFIHLTASPEEIAPDHFTSQIIRLISSKEMIWRIVDVAPEIFYGTTDKWELYSQIHHDIIMRFAIKNIKNWNYE